MSGVQPVGVPGQSIRGVHGGHFPESHRLGFAELGGRVAPARALGRLGCVGLVCGEQGTMPGGQRWSGEQDGIVDLSAGPEVDPPRRWVARSRWAPGPRTERSSCLSWAPRTSRSGRRTSRPTSQRSKRWALPERSSEHLRELVASAHPAHRGRSARMPTLTPAAPGATTGLHEKAKAEADMKRWSAVMSGRSPSFWFGTRRVS